MILGVTGWRFYKDAAFIRSYLSTWKALYECSSMAFLHVRVGDADGADAITRRWCRDNAISHHVFRADWSQGKIAGPRRNERTLLGTGDPVSGPTGLLAGFPRNDGGYVTVPGSGTWGCIIRAFELGIKVEIPPYRTSGD